MHKTFRALIGFALLCLTHEAAAQNIGNSPYSRYGLGEINDNTGSIRNAGMAGAGISAGNSYQANTANPALLYYNSITLFDIGIRGQVKTIKNANQSQRDGDANLANVTLVVPVSKRWSSGLTLRPFSAVDYQITDNGAIGGRPSVIVQKQYEGEGGISELNFAHGIRITPGLTVGASASYLFGTITKESSSLVQDTDLSGLNLERVVYSERTRYSDLLFKAGINYRKELKEKLNMSAGGVYTFGTELNGKRTSSYERRTIYDDIKDENIMPDTLKGNVTLPASWQAGISLDNGSNLTVAADVAMQQWSKFENFNRGNETELADSYKVSVGAEWTPDANSVNSYFKRVTYRGGVYLGNTPYKLNGEQIKDKGVTAGFSFPIGRSTIYDLYQLNASIGYGHRGTTDNGLIAEDYFKFNIGFTINSRWFVKRRID
ncbi:OmpP1/FadL family transporter [Pontibacter arcticus]|uniref:Long-chain fatty acid transport protein n=1 Tax=Pontibacter arcticus TaxID=2080288 RepID=A0A364RIX6_9BACT|nr:hypothetical protein [Pontibacter arcticus]RAU84225.1 hypothetical protein DP923_04060 [Pontibacter arcticus]